MSCSYNDIAVYCCNLKPLSCAPAAKYGTHFRNEIFVLKAHSRDGLTNFYNFMNSIDSSKKYNLTISVPTDSVLEFSDLTLLFDVPSKHNLVDVFSKSTNSFAYIMPFTCSPRRNIEKVQEGAALRPRRICDTDNKIKVESNEYQQYLITRGYKPNKVNKQFSEVPRICRETRQQPSVKMDFKVK